MNENPNNNIKPKRKLLKIILLLISYIAVGSAVWKYAEYVKNDPVKQQEYAQKQVDEIIQKAGALIVLPAEEVPQVTLLQDVETLKKTQDFFKDAQNGDVVLIYQKARKAIIYRDNLDKIVNVLIDINFGTNKNASAATEEGVDVKKEMEVKKDTATTSTR